MKNLVIILSGIFIFSSCGFFNGGEKSEKIGVEIKPGKVGDYALGDNIENIKLLNSQTMTSVDVHVGEGMYETRWFLKDNNLDQLKFSTDDSKKIIEIEVFSPLYKDEKGMGTGSSLQKLMEAYSDILIWYTYVSDKFVAETPQLKNIQFFIDPEAFTGNRDELFVSDMITLTKEQFTSDAKVTTIRVF